MAKAFSGDSGAFLPTTSIFDEGHIRQLNVQSEEFKDFLVDIQQALNNIAMITNIKDSAYYYPQEFVTGAVYFPDTTLNSTTAQAPIGRQVVRKVINFETLPNAGGKSVAHGLTITDPKSVVRLYGGATDPSTSWIPLPFSSPTLNENIKLEVDATNVIITTGIDRTAYTKCYVVIEYIVS